MKREKKPISSYECDKCEAIFSTKHNLYRHINCVHANEKKQIKCKECSRMFARSDTFARHMKTVHPVQKSDREIRNFECWKCEAKFRYRHSIQRHISAKHTDSRYECDTCGTVYHDKMYLLRHFKWHCPNKLSGMERKCSLCGNYFAKKFLFSHYEADHGVNIVKEDFQFPNVEEFYNWKRDMELSTNSSFIKSYWKVNRHYKVTVFRCHRSGKQVIKLSDRSRRTKLQGSKKLNAICPAEVKLRENNDLTCDISFCRTHIGHDLSATKELPYLFFHRNKRVEIADYISRGVLSNRAMLDSNDDILLKDFLSVAVTRSDFLSKTDVHSIQQSHKLNHSSQDNNLCDSDGDVETFISRYSHSFIYYKLENESPDENFPFLKSDDVILVFMSPSQQALLQKHGDNVIAIDENCGPDPHCFTLYTVLVLDYDCEGIPVAFAISNRSDVSVINILLTCIKDRVGILRPNTLMTDMKESHFDCWRLIMDTPSFRLFSTWHVKKGWEQDLNSRIAVKRKRNNIRTMIHNLLAEANVDAFYTRLEELHCIDDEDTANFITYFKDTYSCRAPLWACCYRQNVGININLHVEAFQSTLKQIYSRGQKFTSLYSGLFAVVEYVKQKLMETIAKNIRGALTKKLKCLRKAHTFYTDFAAENEIRFEVEKDDEEWLIQSFQKPKDELVQEMYIVRKMRETCPAEEDTDYGKCNLFCIECQVCAHIYCCTCEENAVKNNMCKHIHAVASTFGPNSGATELLTDDTTVNEVLSATEFVDVDNVICDPKPQDVNGFVKYEDLRPIRESLHRKLEDIKSLIDVANGDVLKVIDKLLAPVPPTMVDVRDSVDSADCIESEAQLYEVKMEENS